MTTTLITGASSGFGALFADRCAAAGHDVVLVARRVDRLNALAAQLIATYGVSAHVIACDLAASDGPAALVETLAGQNIVVDELINNAGLGSFGSFATTDPVRAHDQVAVNVQAVVDLTRAVLPGMLARGSGRILNIGSTTAFQPVPDMALYSASKAFIVAFTEALWHECKDTGVRVMVYCPGPSATEFFAGVGDCGVVGQHITPEDAVDAALAGLWSGNAPTIVSGWVNVVNANMPRLLPRRMAPGIVAGLMAMARRSNRPTTPAVASAPVLVDVPDGAAPVVIDLTRPASASGPAPATQPAPASGSADS